MNLLWFLSSVESDAESKTVLDSELARPRRVLTVTAIALASFFLWAYGLNN